MQNVCFSIERKGKLCYSKFIINVMEVSMRIIKAKDYQDMSRKAANIISAQIILKPDCVLGLATGSTPIGTYEQLIRWYEKGDLDFSQVHSINLDEYRGLSPENDQSYRYFMNTHLFDKINIDKKNTYVPDGLEPDKEKACRDYEEIIHAHGGVDLQILETHCVALTVNTRQANVRFFASMYEVPTEAYTMGIKSIMQAKKIMVIVSGESKREIVKKAFHGPITPEVPASVLQLHSDVILVGDEAALEDFPR